MIWTAPQNHGLYQSFCLAFEQSGLDFDVFNTRFEVAKDTVHPKMAMVNQQLQRCWSHAKTNDVVQSAINHPKWPFIIIGVNSREYRESGQSIRGDSFRNLMGEAIDGLLK